jgi:uncharacterized phage infection (PIP) family protein YhgE
LLEPAKALETTEALYRFRTSVSAAKSASMTVKEELVDLEYIEILPGNIETLLVYARTGAISKNVRDAIAKAVSLKQQMEQLKRDVQQIQRDINKITSDQTRIRENIKVAPDNSALKNNNLAKLAEQEKLMDDLFKRLGDSEKALAAKQRELDDYVQNLNIE